MHVELITGQSNPAGRPAPVVFENAIATVSRRSPRTSASVARRWSRFMSSTSKLWTTAVRLAAPSASPKSSISATRAALPGSLKERNNASPM